MPGHRCAVQSVKCPSCARHDSASTPLRRAPIEQEATGCVDRQMVEPTILALQPWSVALCRFLEVVRACRRQLIGIPGVHRSRELAAMRTYSRGEFRPSFDRTCPSRNQRAQGMPGARRTHCLACKTKRRTQANTGTPKSLRHSLRNGLRLIARSPRSTGLVSPRRLPIISTDLIPASGDQDHTPSPSASTRIVCALPRPPQPASRFVTIGRNVPPSGGGLLL
jgi:hypothetical protein